MELEQFWRSLDLVCEEEASSEDKDDFDNTSTSSISQATMSALEKESRKERRR